jgi:iron transport multicopper oxidase
MSNSSPFTLSLCDNSSIHSHLHGHKFQIVNRVTDYTSTDPVLNPPIEEGQANPMRRDTVQVPPGSSVALRIISDNPGAWMFHCSYPPLSLFPYRY